MKIILLWLSVLFVFGCGNAKSENHSIGQIGDSIENEESETNRSPKPCEYYFKDSVDRFTDEEEIGTDLIFLKNDDKELAFKVDVNNNIKGVRSYFSLIFMPQTLDYSGCIDEDAKVILLFTDKSKLNAKNDYSFNCKGIAGLVFFSNDVDDSEFAISLKTKRLQAIRISLRSETFEYDFKPRQAEEIYEMINCGIKKMKS